MDLTVDSINYENLAKRIAEKFLGLFDADICTLWRRTVENNQDVLVLSASAGFERGPGEELPSYPLDWDARANTSIEGVTAWIALRNRVCHANSYRELALDPHAPWYGTHRGKWDSLTFMGNDASRNFRSLLGLPVTYGPTAQVIGVVKIENKRSRNGFTTSDRALAEALLPFIGISLQAMTRREQHESDRQRVLKELTTALPTVDIKEFHQKVVEKTALLLQADICSLWLVSSDRTKLVFAANHGVRGKSKVPEYALNWHAADDRDIDGLTPWVAIRQRPFFASKFEDLKLCPAHRGKWDPIQWGGSARDEFGALYAVPLLRADTSIGVLKIENSRGKHVFDEVDKATFDVMAGFIALAIELGSRLRSDIVFDFFHLLKQPTTNAVWAFQSLRDELSRQPSRADRISERLEWVARNLEGVRVWTMNVYGLASTPAPATNEGREPVRLADLFSGVVAEVRKLFPELQCILDLGEDDIHLSLTQLQRRKAEVIIFNILDNSFKYSRPRGITKVRAVDCGEEYRVEISDNGMGIAHEDLDRIFEPYFSRPAPEWTESMGLGLATVQRLLDEFGWGRSVSSQKGVGTTFTVIIPHEDARGGGALEQ